MIRRCYATKPVVAPTPITEAAITPEQTAQIILPYYPLHWKTCFCNTLKSGSKQILQINKAIQAILAEK